MGYANCQHDFTDPFKIRGKIVKVRCAMGTPFNSKALAYRLGGGGGGLWGSISIIFCLSTKLFWVNPSPFAAPHVLLVIMPFLRGTLVLVRDHGFCMLRRIDPFKTSPISQVYSGWGLWEMCVIAISHHL